MSIDPIQMLKETSTFAATNTPKSPVANPPPTSGSNPTTASAFILNDSLAKLVSRGGQGLSGASLSGYNAQALQAQSTQMLVGNLPAGDASSSVLSQMNNLQSLRIMQGAAAGTQVSPIENGPDVIAQATGKTPTPDKPAPTTATATPAAGTSPPKA